MLQLAHILSYEKIENNNFIVPPKMLYDLVFHLNLDLGIFNQLGIIVTITLFH
jgi:hypothetical protein